MSTYTLERAVIDRMLRDPELSPRTRTPDLSSLPVAERNFTEVGFITSFKRSEATRLFEDNMSARWGKVIGRLNSSVDVDFLVYVDEGYLSAVESSTFGGELWPSDVVDFELRDRPEG